MIDSRKCRQYLPTGKLGWLVAILVAGIGLGLTLLLDRGSTTAAVTYVLF